jgi:hypothetical protein
VFKDVQAGTERGKLGGDEIGTLASDGVTFVSSCMGVTEIASDPIGWLVGEGLRTVRGSVSVCDRTYVLLSG